MRRAFGILESLFALVVFSIVILVCSQTLLQVHQDLRIYKQIQSEETELSNAVLYLQKIIQNSIITHVSPTQIEYFEINQAIFLSSSFLPWIERCDSNRVPKQGESKYVAMFDHSFEIARVLGEESGWLILDRKAKCSIGIPLKEKHQIFLSGEVLYVDERILLDGVKNVRFQRQGQNYQIKICQSFCVEKEIFGREIVHEF